jgi:hypothetical protein
MEIRKLTHDTSFITILMKIARIATCCKIKNLAPDVLLNTRYGDNHQIGNSDGILLDGGDCALFTVGCLPRFLAGEGSQWTYNKNR